MKEKKVEAITENYVNDSQDKRSILSFHEKKLFC